LAGLLFEKLQLHATVRIHSSKLDIIAKEMIEKATNRHKILDKIIELCSDIDTPRAYYLIGNAYIWKGAKYRKNATERANSTTDPNQVWEMNMTKT